MVGVCVPLYEMLTEALVEQTDLFLKFAPLCVLCTADVMYDGCDVRCFVIGRVDGVTLCRKCVG